MLPLPDPHFFLDKVSDYILKTLRPEDPNQTVSSITTFTIVSVLPVSPFIRKGTAQRRARRCQEECYR